MTTLADPALSTPMFAARLHERLAELRALLQAAASEAVGAGEDPPDLSDFKDVAAEDTRARIDDAAIAHTRAEVDQVLAALRRIDDGSYGLCEDCGEPIDERRLLALPATPFCTPCQALRERAGAPRR